MHTHPSSQIVDEDWINIVKVVEEMANYILGNLYYVRVEVFTAVTMKNAVFWDVSEERIVSETSVNKISTGRHIPEDGILRNLYSQY
jgi:hypothetical protein